MSIAEQPATPNQRNLIDVWRMQLGMTDRELDYLAQDHGAPSIDAATRKVAGAVITDLQRLRAEQQRRNRL